MRLLKFADDSQSSAVIFFICTVNLQSIFTVTNFQRTLEGVFRLVLMLGHDLWASLRPRWPRTAMDCHSAWICAITSAWPACCLLQPALEDGLDAVDWHCPRCAASWWHHVLMPGGSAGLCVTWRSLILIFLPSSAGTSVTPAQWHMSLTQNSFYDLLLQIAHWSSVGLSKQHDCFFTQCC